MDHLWRLGRYLAVHSAIWTIEDAEIWVLEVSVWRDGLETREWVRIAPTFCAVREWLGY